ncbi:MAG TPA: hypothetical protein PKU70_06240 [Vicinamibacteria bacterium]|nr:hypothetical protein [Vicinamibacteria bacterium]
MGDSIATAMALIDDRLEELHALMTDEAIDVVTGRYLAWKSAATATLAEIFVESMIRRFELAQGAADHGDRHRPTPPVYLDGAASRAVLMAMKRDLEKDPAAVLRRPPRQAGPDPALAGVLKIVNLLKRRLPRAFRGKPETDLDVRNGFETLLAGAEIAYERQGESTSEDSCAPDFTFPDLQAALKLKLCDQPEREVEIAAEINREISGCRARYRQVVFGVFDLGFIREPDRFCGAFSAHEGVWVRVLKS